MRFADPLPPGRRTFESRLRVNWADIDIAGIMYFAAYWRFAERAEMDFFREIGFPYDSVFEEYDVWLPRVHVDSTYHAPAFMDDWLRMRTHVEHVGASSVRWTTVMFNERSGEAGAVLRFTIACMDRATKKSRPLPPPLRSRLLECIERPS